MQCHTQDPVLTCPTRAKGDLKQEKAPQGRDGGRGEEKEVKGGLGQRVGEKKAKTCFLYIIRKPVVYTPNPPTQANTADARPSETLALPSLHLDQKALVD